jgi:hypothetical protein
MIDIALGVIVVALAISMAALAALLVGVVVAILSGFWQGE